MQGMKGRVEVSLGGSQLGRWALVGGAFFAFVFCGFVWGEGAVNPYDGQVLQKIKELGSSSEDVRCNKNNTFPFSRLL